jgi:multiple sugar transport system permease protein
VKETRATVLGLVWVSPWLVGFVLFLAVPLGMSLYYSFTDYPLLESPLWAGLANYERMLHDERLHKVLWNTFLYGLITIPLSIVLSVVIAALLNAKVKGAKFFQAAIFLPTLVPLIATSMVWMWILNGQYGLINAVLRPIWPVVRGAVHALPEGRPGSAWAGWRTALENPPNWLLDAHWALLAVVLVALWSVGQQVLLCLAALREVPAQLYEAADLDGMGAVRKFWYVTIPMISPVILFNAITLTIGTLQVFVVPYVIFQKDKGGPGQSAYFYTMYLYDNAFTYQQMGYASALAWVQLLIILALTGLMFLASKRLVHYRA